MRSQCCSIHCNNIDFLILAIHNIKCTDGLYCTWHDSLHIRANNVSSEFETNQATNCTADWLLNLPMPFANEPATSQSHIRCLHRCTLKKKTIGNSV